MKLRCTLLCEKPECDASTEIILDFYEDMGVHEVPGRYQVFEYKTLPNGWGYARYGTRVFCPKHKERS